MTVKQPHSAIPVEPGDDVDDRLGGWISGGCWWTDSGPAGVLAALQADFPQFQIWPEVTLDRLRYVSVSKRLDLHPHTVVTDSLAELRASCSRPRRPPPTPQIDNAKSVARRVPPAAASRC